MGDRRIQNSLTRQPIHYDVRTLCQFDNLTSLNLDFQNLQWQIQYTDPYVKKCFITFSFNTCNLKSYNYKT